MKQYYDNADFITRWFLVRHAPVVHNGNLIYGNNDIMADLKDSEIHCQYLAKIIPQNPILLTSALQRAIDTATAIENQGITLRKMQQLANFNEQNFGDWQDSTYQELQKKDPDFYQRFWITPAHLCPPNGESFAHLHARVCGQFLESTEQFKGDNILLVSHAGVIKSLLALVLDLPLEAAFRISTLNYSLTMIDVLHYKNNLVYRLRAVNLLPFYP